MWIMPLSLCSVVAKVLTYWSYDAVPVAIAHTCKVRAGTDWSCWICWIVVLTVISFTVVRVRSPQASQPFFNVILAYLIYRSKFTFATYLSLVPIVLGVVLASVSEMGMNVRPRRIGRWT